MFMFANFIIFYITINCALQKYIQYINLAKTTEIINGNKSIVRKVYFI